MAEVLEWSLHRACRFRLGEFWCPPDSPRWRAPNVIPDRPHVAFPRTSTIIRHVGDEPTLANANHVIFYNAGQRYERALHDPRGDRCWFLELDPSLVGELVDHGEFRFVSGPGDSRVRLLLHAAVRHLADERADLLLAEEAIMVAFARAVAAAASLHREGSPASRPADRGLVERAKALLTETVYESLSLGELGRRLHTSEYHLARIFRAGTGLSLHRYRNNLRLRIALDHLTKPDTNIAWLAHTLGYARRRTIASPRLYRAVQDPGAESRDRWSRPLTVTDRTGSNKGALVPTTVVTRAPSAKTLGRRAPSQDQDSHGGGFVRNRRSVGRRHSSLTRIGRCTHRARMSSS